MKVITANGWELDTEGGFAKSGTEYARRKGYKDLIVCFASKGDEKEYVILRRTKKESVPIYSSQQFEAIGCFIDVLHLMEESGENK